jgi:hypothetical protein
MLRWTLRILLALIVLFVAAAVGLHFVLRSDWLGERVLTGASGQLGLSVGAQSFATGWGGRTTLRAVTVRMPLRDEEFLSAERIELAHTAVPLLLLGRPMRIHAVEIEGPVVNVRQYANGGWNVQDVWARVKASLPARGRQSREVRLPHIVLHNASVRITEPNETTQTVSPVEFDGHREGPLLWAFALHAEPFARAEGRLVVGGDWRHEMGFAIQGIGPLVRRIAQRDLTPVQISGRWRGNVVQSAVAGTLHLDQSTVGPAVLGGEVHLEAKADHVTVAPRGLTVNEPNRAGEPVQLTGGAVEVSREQLVLAELAGQAGRLAGYVDGRWDWGARRGPFCGSWVVAGPDGSAPYQGTYQVSLRSPPEGRQEAEASLTAQAQTPLGSWRIAFEVAGAAADWPASQWRVALPTLSWSRNGREVDLSGAAARIDLQWPQVRLVSLEVPQAKQVHATARFDADTRRWSAELALEQLRLAALGADGLDLRLRAAGDARVAQVSELRLAQGEKLVTAQGEFSFPQAELRNVHLAADWPAQTPSAGPTSESARPAASAAPEIRHVVTADLESPTRFIALGGPSDPGAQSAMRDPPALSPAPPAAISSSAPRVSPAGLPADRQGRWHLETGVAGQLRPVALTATGTLTGQNIALGQRLVERLEVPVQANVDARQIHLATEPFDWLGGSWQLRGRHQFANRWTRLSVSATGLSVEAAARLAGLPAGARGRGQAELQLVMPRFDLHHAAAVGSWSAQDVDIPPLAAEQAHGSLRIADGLVRLDDIQLEQQGGSALASLEFHLDNPQVLSTELRTEAWPVRFANGAWALQADAQAKLSVNVARRTADGQARLAGRVLWNDRPLADLHLSTLVQGQTLDVRELHVETLGGTVAGTARLPLARWTNSVADLRWQGVEPSRLAAWQPPLERFQGRLSGALTVAPTGQAHAPEPLGFVLDVNAPGGHFGPAAIDAGRFHGYLGPKRLLLDEAEVRALDGWFRGRARVSIHPGGYYGAVTADFRELSLDQLAHLLAPNAGAYAGRLSGSATLLPAVAAGPESAVGDQASEGLADQRSGAGGPPAALRIAGRTVRLGGEARLHLTESDLANNSIVRTLYNTLSLRFGVQEPAGTGTVRLRFEGPALVVPSVVYFNRGVEIRGAATLADWSRGGASPLTGYAVGSSHILQGLPLPGVGALDKLLASLQTGAASVQIAGSLAQPRVTLVPLPEILIPFRNLLWAQLRE